MKGLKKFIKRLPIRLAFALFLIITFPVDLIWVIFAGRQKFWMNRLHQAAEALKISHELDQFFHSWVKNKMDAFGERK